MAGNLRPVRRLSRAKKRNLPQIARATRRTPAQKLRSSLKSFSRPGVRKLRVKAPIRRRTKRII